MAKSTDEVIAEKVEQYLTKSERKATRGNVLLGLAAIGGLCYGVRRVTRNREVKVVEETPKEK